MRGSPSHPRPSRRDRRAQVWQCESSLDCMDKKLTGKRPEFLICFRNKAHSPSVAATFFLRSLCAGLVLTRRCLQFTPWSPCRSEDSNGGGDTRSCVEENIADSNRNGTSTDTAQAS